MGRGINWKYLQHRLSKMQRSPSCNKSSRTDEDLNTVPTAVINPYWDSLYVTTTNHTHPQLSCLKHVYQVKIKSGSEPHLEIRVVDGNNITVQNILKPGNTSVLINQQSSVFQDHIRHLK